MSDTEIGVPKISETRLARNMVEACFEMLDISLDAAISVMDENLEYVYCNDAMYKQTGLSPSDLRVGDSLEKCHNLMVARGMITPEIIERNKLSATSQKQRNGSTVFSSIMELSDGRKMKLNRTTLKNGYTVSVSQDVSEHVERDMLLEDALVLGQAGYWTYDIASKMVYLSKSLENYFSDRELKGMDLNGVANVAIPEDRPLLGKAIKEALAGSGRFEFSSRTICPDGKTRRGMTIGEIVYDGFGKPAKIRALVKDISGDYEKSKALEAAKDEAISASIAKSEFLANMSHEIRTPMNGILGMADLLGQSDIDERQREFVNVIDSSAKALLTIINDILDFSKIEAGALALEPVPFDLHQSVHDVGALMKSAAGDKKLELVVNYAPDLPRHFIGDAGRIRQVLNNLVSNAVKFTETGFVKIDVSVTSVRNNVNVIKMSVSDTGIGIAPEKLDDVFKKFTQGDGSTTRLYGGTGLGLSITKCIVELMNGRIRVRSKLGQGSMFTVAIPLPADPNAQPICYDTATLSNRRILVVDDIAVNRTILSEQLRAWDVDPVVAVDGAQALEILSGDSEDSNFDMVLLDYLMPDIDGLSLAQTITERADIAPVPLVMLTSYDPPMNREDMAERGILDCLTKPIREQNLYQRLIKHFPTEKTNGRQEQSSTVPETAVAPLETAKIEVLVAEDFELNQDVVRLMLADSEFSPVFADNGQIAVDKFLAEPDRFEAILMDISMPVKDGYQAAQDILNFEAETGRRHTPIIALTGHALKHDREKCLTSGMDEYLTKPVKRDELVAALRENTQSREALRQVA